jgi:hypothetical protein
MKCRLFGRTFVLLVVALAAACDTESSRPTVPTGPGPSTPSRILNSLRLTGPDTIHLGEPSQFTLTAQYSDGTTADESAQASWRGFNSGVVSMTAPGLFTGRANGETAISAAIGNRTATMSSIIVVPPGTYRLKGTVRDAGVPVDAHVEITSGAIGEREFDTGPQGTYVIYGVGGDTRIKVTKSGYEEFSRTEAVTDHRVIDVDLRLQRSRADVAGRYTLTIAAAGECSALPDEARTRIYGATIQQAGPELFVKLEGQAAISSATNDQFTGLVEAERAVFRFQSSFYYYYWYFPFVTELIAPGVYYGFDGTATTSISANELSGTLVGNIATYPTSLVRPLASCHSTDHRFVFRR